MEARPIPDGYLSWLADSPRREILAAFGKPWNSLLRHKTGRVYAVVYLSARMKSRFAGSWTDLPLHDIHDLLEDTLAALNLVQKQLILIDREIWQCDFDEEAGCPRDDAQYFWAYGADALCKLAKEWGIDSESGDVVEVFERAANPHIPWRTIPAEIKAVWPAWSFVCNDIRQRAQIECDKAHAAGADPRLYTVAQALGIRRARRPVLLNETAKKAGEYIDAHPYCKGLAVAFHLHISPEYFRGDIVSALKTHGYTNTRGKGYHGP